MRLMKDDSKGFWGKIGGWVRMQRDGILGNLKGMKRRFLEIYGKNRFRDKSLLKAYVGGNYEKIATRRFNVAGFFFTSLYLFYRKMRWTAIGMFAVQIGLIVLTKNLVIKDMAPNLAVDVFHQLVISLFVGCLVNKYYLWDAEHKVAILRQRYPQATHAELKGICMVRGGRSVAVAVPWVVLEILISTIISVAMLISQILSGVPAAVKNFEHEVQNAIEAGMEMFRPRNVEEELEGTGEKLEKGTKNESEKHEGVEEKVLELIEKK